MSFKQNAYGSLRTQGAQCKLRKGRVLHSPLLPSPNLQKKHVAKPFDNCLAGKQSLSLNQTVSKRQSLLQESQSKNIRYISWPSKLKQMGTPPTVDGLVVHLASPNKTNKKDTPPKTPTVASSTQKWGHDP